jgi:hypothetical protein
VIEDVRSHSIQIEEVDQEVPEPFVATVYVPPDMNLEIIRMSALRDSEVLFAGWYFAACAFDPASQFVGASLLESKPPFPSSYEFLRSVPKEATMGFVLAQHPDFAKASPLMIDYVTTFDVQLYHGSLESRQLIDVLNGKNWAVVGGEYIAFVDADEIGLRQYRIRGLLRGQRNTQDKIADSKLVDPRRFILLSALDQEVQFVQHSTSVIGQPRRHKCPSQGQSVAEVDHVEKSLLGNTLRPFPPANLRAARYVNNADIRVQWNRVSRFIHDFLATTDPPMTDEPNELYEVDLIKSSTGAVLRTKVSTGSVHEVTYTVAQQTADGLTPGTDLVDVKVYQMGEAFGGRGRPAEVLGV